MKEREWLEDYSVGEKMVSIARTITESDVVDFAKMSGDWYSIHVDKEYAKTTVFGDRIAHGFLTIALGGSMCMWLGPNTFIPKSFIAFLGLDNVRLTVPTKIGDTIHWEGTITAIEPKSKGRGVITYSVEIINQRGEVGASFIHKVLVMQKPK